MRIESFGASHDIMWRLVSSIRPSSTFCRGQLPFRMSGSHWWILDSCTMQRWYLRVRAWLLCLRRIKRGERWLFTSACRPYIKSSNFGGAFRPSLSFSSAWTCACNDWWRTFRSNNRLLDLAWFEKTAIFFDCCGRYLHFLPALFSCSQSRRSNCVGSVQWRLRDWFFGHLVKKGV